MNLHDVAAAFREALPQGDPVLAFRIDALDRLGIPVCEAALLPRDGTTSTIGYGYGFEPIEAEVGALGELCEEFHVETWIARAPRTVASYAELVRTRGARHVADPLTLCLPAGSDWTPDTVLPWVEAHRHPSGESVLVPVEWVAAYPYQMAETPDRKSVV